MDDTTQTKGRAPVENATLSTSSSSDYSSSLHPENIPAELKALKQWVCWRIETRNGKPSKAPIQANSSPDNLRYAASNRPRTWTDFDTAVAAAGRLGLNGVGVNVWTGDNLTGVDLDHVFNPDTGELTAEAVEVLDRFNGTYIEVSPSGTGLRIWCYGKPKRSGKMAGRTKWLEVYSHPSNRFLTCTGNRWPGAATAVTEQQAALDWLHERWMKQGSTVRGDGDGKRAPHTSTVDPYPDDAALIEKACNGRHGAAFSALWTGDLSAYGGDHSAADIALCNALAWWTDRDAARIDRLFRQSGLMRPKWDVVHDPAGNRSYGQMTVDRAIADCRGGYAGRPAAGGGDTQAGPAGVVARGQLVTGWQAELMRKRNSVELLKNHFNAVMVVENALPGLVGYNEFRQRIEARIPSPWRKTVGQWTEADTAELAFYLAKKFASFTLDMLAAAVMTVAYRHPFNPAQDRLRALSESWDGKPRLNTWLIDLLGAAHNASNENYLREIGAAWLKGVAARVLMPGCKRDDVLILRGDQGIGKSTAAQCIADCIHPDSFTDSLGSLDSKDSKAAIRGIIIAELGELSVLNKSDLETVKAYVATRTDHFREAYGRGERDYPRTVSFIGTTNHPTFLKDPTGNRRFWPVTIQTPIPISRLKAALPQVVGEAARRVLAGESWYVSDATAIAQAENVRAAHFQDDVWTEAALNAARHLLDGGKCTRCGGSGYRDTSYPDGDGTPGQCFQCHGTGTLPGANPDYVTVAAILTAMGVRIEQQTIANQMRVGAILRVADWKDRKKRVGDWKEGKTVWAWYPPTVPPFSTVPPSEQRGEHCNINDVPPVTPCSTTTEVLIKIGNGGGGGDGEKNTDTTTNFYPLYGSRGNQGEQGVTENKINVLGEKEGGNRGGNRGGTGGEQSKSTPPVDPFKARVHELMQHGYARTNAEAAARSEGLIQTGGTR